MNNSNILSRIIDHLLFKFRVAKRKYQNRYVIPDYKEKRKILKEYAIKYNCKTFVETGTFLGDTIASLKDIFKSLYSIELSNELAQNAQNKFKNDNHIEIIQGDSGVVLKEIKITDKPALFWLDGHYSSSFKIGDKLIQTARGISDTPIFEELQTVLKNGLESNVILIDDARCFGEEKDYPTKRELINFITTRGVKKSQIKIKRDIIRITPD